MFQLFHKTDFTDGRAGCAFFAVEVDLFEGHKSAGLAVAAFEHSRVCSLSELLQLLEAGGVSFVHGSNSTTAAETVHRDVAVGAVAHAQCANVSRMQTYFWWLTPGVFGIPQIGSSGRELVGDGKLRRGFVGGRE